MFLFFEKIFIVKNLTQYSYTVICIGGVSYYNNFKNRSAKGSQRPVTNNLYKSGRFTKWEPTKLMQYIFFP